MKVLLSSLRSPFLDDDKVYPPLALLYLQPAVQQAGHECSITDELDYDHPEQYAGYNVLGFSVMTPQRHLAVAALDWVRTRLGNDVLAVIGGPHAQHYTTECLDEGWDFVVSGDGERSLPEILNGEAAGRLVQDKMSAAELNDMPRPSRLENAAFLEGYSYELLDGVRSTTAMSGRGCPMKCTFCEDARTPTRWTNADNFEKELEDIARLGYKAVYIFDDLFAISKRKVAPYLDKLAELNLKFRCNGHAKFMDDEFAAMLAAAGCAEIAFGAESGSQTILDNVKKETTVQQNYEFVTYCRQYGIKVKAFLMLGLPGETAFTIRDTEHFIRDSGVDDFQLAVYSPYKGTQIRDAIDKGGDGLVDLMFQGEKVMAYGQKGGRTEACVRTAALSAEQILKERDRLVDVYRPASHTRGRSQADDFFDTHLGPPQAGGGE